MSAPNWERIAALQDDMRDACERCGELTNRVETALVQASEAYKVYREAAARYEAAISDTRWTCIDPADVVTSARARGVLA